MLAHQLTIQQQLNGVIERGPAYPVVFIFHQYVKRLYVKVLIMVIDLLENGIALGRFPLLVLLQIFSESLLYNFEILVSCHQCAKGGEVTNN